MAMTEKFELRINSSMKSFYNRSSTVLLLQMQNDIKHLFVLSGIAKNPVYINSDNSSMI